MCARWCTNTADALFFSSFRSFRRQLQSKSTGCRGHHIACNSATVEICGRTHKKCASSVWPTSGARSLCTRKLSGFNNAGGVTDVVCHALLELGEQSSSAACASNGRTGQAFGAITVLESVDSNIFSSHGGMCFSGRVVLVRHLHGWHGRCLANTS